MFWQRFLLRLAVAFEKPAGTAAKDAAVGRHVIATILRENWHHRSPSCQIYTEFSA